MLETTSLAIIVTIAGFLQGLTGFGFGLITLPLLGLFFDIKTIIPLVVMLALCISLIQTFQFRKFIKLKDIYVLIAATVPGIPLGVYTLKQIPAGILAIGLGVLMIVFTTYQLLTKSAPRLLGLSSTILAGLSSGILGGSIGAGGPPVIVYSTMQPWSKDQTKATLAFYFSISGMIISMTHAYTGLITQQVRHLFLISLPTLAIGIFLGTLAYTRISDREYKRLALVIVFFLGCMMLYRNIV
jgi:hypothetical protein